jgi:hypothetical protein
MSEPVEQGAGEAFGAEDFGPFLEGQVRGDQSRAALVALAAEISLSALGDEHHSYRPAFQNRNSTMGTQTLGDNHPPRLLHVYVILCHRGKRFQRLNLPI